LASAIKTALVEWEPRIELDAVRVEPVESEPSQALITVEYRIRTTNELFNVVFPLYLEEGVS
jgi:phage baseplate assembly protein W